MASLGILLCGSLAFVTHEECSGFYCVRYLGKGSCHERRAVA